MKLSKKGQSLLEALLLCPLIVISIFYSLEILMCLHLYFLADSLGYDYLVCRNSAHIQSSRASCEQSILDKLTRDYRGKIQWSGSSSSVEFILTSKLLTPLRWTKKYAPM